MYRFSYLILFLLTATILAIEPVDKNALRLYPPEIVSIRTQSDPFIEELVAKVHRDSLYNILAYLDEKGIKNAGSSTCNEVGQWLQDILSEWDYEVATQDVSGYGKNIIAEKNGTITPKIKVVIGAHYDSVRSGPGVNDNGSGVAALLEIARIFKDVQTEYSIIFALFTAEESGMVGSKAYVNKVYAEGMDILVNFNMDQIGGIKDITASHEMTTITCERDEGNSQSGNNTASYAYTDTLAMMTSTYTVLKAGIAHAYGSDYMKFEAKGYVITGYYEYVPWGNPYYHKSTDLLKNMNVPYLTEVTKGAVAFTAHVAKYVINTASVFNLPEHKPQKNIVIKLHPDPSNKTVWLSYHLTNPGLVELILYDGSGRKIGLLHNGYRPAGMHSVRWEYQNYGSSLYVIKPAVNGKPFQSIKLPCVK